MASARIGSDREMRGFPKTGSPRIVSDLLGSDTKRHIFRQQRCGCWADFECYRAASFGGWSKISQCGCTLRRLAGTFLELSIGRGNETYATDEARRYQRTRASMRSNQGFRLARRP